MVFIYFEKYPNYSNRGYIARFTSDRAAVFSPIEET